MAEPKSEEGPRRCWRRDQDTKRRRDALAALLRWRGGGRLRDIRRRAREREMVELLLVKQFAQGHRLVRRADGRRCRFVARVLVERATRGNHREIPVRGKDDAKQRVAVARSPSLSPRRLGRQKRVARRDSLQRTDGDPFKVGERSF